MERPADLDKLLNEQAELAEASSAAGKAVAQTVGDISQSMLHKTGDKEWGEGGAYKTILQGVGAALVAQLGNGEGLNAALGAISSQLATDSFIDAANTAVKSRVIVAAYFLLFASIERPIPTAGILAIKLLLDASAIAVSIHDDIFPLMQLYASLGVGS